eukprot:GHVN01011008.1.p1 GENE.GHVN01011008.1~~GHVN01011008.1.p1  ORF type:complete len:572 (+),score=156.54 GHVN01011008.1:197-1912(+)
MAEPPSQILGDLESLTKDPKATDDFSQKTAEVVPQAEQMRKAGRIDEGVNLLLAVEKKARQAADAFSVSRICCAILNMYKENKDWVAVGENILVLTKKRGQLKKVIVDVVQLGMEWVASDELMSLGVSKREESEERKLQLIETLSTVTEGKIFVENQRARLIKMLAVMKENKGDIEGAATLLQEVQVETYGAMDKIERAEYILAQMRIVLAHNDFVRCQIVSRKINPKLLQTDDMQHCNIRFNEFMVRYNLHEDELLSVAKNFYSIFCTKAVNRAPAYRKEMLECYVIYLILASFSNEQADLLNKVSTIERKKLAEVPMVEKLVTDFLKKELIPWPLPSYASDLKSHPVFTSSPPSLPSKSEVKEMNEAIEVEDKAAKASSNVEMSEVGETDKTDTKMNEVDKEAKASEVKGEKESHASLATTAAVIDPPFLDAALLAQKDAQLKAYKGGEARWELLRKRVVQHNLQVISAYYRRATLARLSELLGVDVSRVESEVSEMVTDGFLKAKIDRPAGIVVFGEKLTARDRLDEWGGEINSILDTIEESCHLIAKERMVHAARSKAAEMAAKTRE